MEAQDGVLALRQAVQADPAQGEQVAVEVADLVEELPEKVG